MKKYVVIPDEVMSKNDRQIHYVGAGQLMWLYGVHPNECYVVRNEGDARGLPRGLKVLRPRYDGNYQL